MLDKKIERMRKRERIEELILKIEDSDISADDRRTVSSLKKEIESLMSRVPNDDHKLYLSEIIEQDGVSFSTNNLILAPVGSGKSTLISELVPKCGGKALMLVSNRFLKDDVVPPETYYREARVEKGESRGMFTSQNSTRFGDEDYSIHVMTYAEFGRRIQKNNQFINEGGFSHIFCDEIHSLPEYKKFSNSEPLIHAIKYLFSKHNDVTIFYFTATRDNLDALEREIPGTLSSVMVFNYLEHPEIKKYMALSEYKINHIEQIRPHLESRLKSFNYFKHKGLAFSRTISGQKRIVQILIEEGYQPLVLWSDKNDKHPLSSFQLKAREQLIRTNKIPEPYNFLVINSALREGWDLKDSKVKLAIMNTSNNTDSIQALGRIRNDVDILVYRTNEKLKEESICIPKEYLDIPLTTECKKRLATDINKINDRGDVIQWTKIKQLAIDNDYNIEDKREVIDGKRVRISYIRRS